MIKIQGGLVKGLKDPGQSLSSFFAAFTAHYALPFDCGYLADESQNVMPHPFNQVVISLDVKFVPLSREISSGTPLVANSFLRTFISFDDMAPPGLKYDVLLQSEYLSTNTK